MSATKPSKCPYCGKVLDHASPIEDKEIVPEPEKGGNISYTVCSNCANICAFDKDMLLRKVTDEEMKTFEIIYPDLYEKLMYTQACIDRMNNALASFEAFKKAMRDSQIFGTRHSNLN